MIPSLSQKQLLEREHVNIVNYCARYDVLCTDVLNVRPVSALLVPPMLYSTRTKRTWQPAQTFDSPEPGL